MRQFFVAAVMYLLLASGAFAQADSGVHFEQTLSWTQVKEKAKRENKFIFIDCFATWCGPCKAMDKDVYPQKKVGDYLNEHFVSIKMQFDTSAQDNEQVRKLYTDSHLIIQDYKVNAFPTLLFFSPNGNIVHREVGYKNEDGFIAITKDAMDPDKQYYTLLERYNRRDLDTSDMKSFAHSVKAMGDKELAGKIANNYINQLPEENLYATDNVWFMVEFTGTSKDRGFLIFKDHANKIYQSVDQIGVENSKALVENIIYNEEIKPCLYLKDGGPDWSRMLTNVKKYDSLGIDTYENYKPGIVFTSTIEPALKKDPDWAKTLSLIKSQNVGKGQEFLVGSSVVFYLNRGLVSGAYNDCKNLIAAASYYFKNYYSYLTADPLNNWAWTIFERSSEKKELATALVWSDSCLKLCPKPDPSYIDTYANLLYKLGRSAEAIVWEEKAVTLDPRSADIQNNLMKMKKGEHTW